MTPANFSKTAFELEAKARSAKDSVEKSALDDLVQAYQIFARKADNVPTEAETELDILAERMVGNTKRHLSPR